MLSQTPCSVSPRRFQVQPGWKQRSTRTVCPWIYGKASARRRNREGKECQLPALGAQGRNSHPIWVFSATNWFLKLTVIFLRVQKHCCTIDSLAWAMMGTLAPWKSTTVPLPLHPILWRSLFVYQSVLYWYEPECETQVQNHSVTFCSINRLTGG